jgi:hypothetical protein
MPVERRCGARRGSEDGWPGAQDLTPPDRCRGLLSASVERRRMRSFTRLRDTFPAALPTERRLPLTARP